jgi:hypothetical protein
MAELTFGCTEAHAVQYAATPTLSFTLTITESTGVRVHAIALRCQIRIEPHRRRYSADEARRLNDLFGDTSRWPETVKPIQLATVSTMVTGFTSVTETELQVPCTYDLEVASARYLQGLDDGTIPLLPFSGTVFIAQGESYSVQLIPWSSEASYRMPLRVWQDIVSEHFPGSAWLRCTRETLDEVRRIADAVLYEGYILYPYRASAQKNRSRWQFGVLMPPVYATTDPSEAATLQAECVFEHDGQPAVEVAVRFLQVQRRDAPGAVPSVWDEAVEQEVAVTAASPALLGDGIVTRFSVPGGEETETVSGVRVVRRREPLAGSVSVRGTPLPGPWQAARLTVRVTNESGSGPGAGRRGAGRRGAETRRCPRPWSRPT